MINDQEPETDPSRKLAPRPLQFSRLTRGSSALTYHRRPPHRVLLGIGDIDLRNETYSLMTNKGLDVQSSEDGDHLLQSIGDAILQMGASARPELIIADSMLPRCNGEELRKAIKELNWQIPLILLDAGEATAYRNESSSLTLGHVDAQYLCDFSERLLDTLECAAPRRLPVPLRRWFSSSDALRTVTIYSNRVSKDKRGRAR